MSRQQFGARVCMCVFTTNTIFWVCDACTSQIAVPVSTTFLVSAGTGWHRHTVHAHMFGTAVPLAVRARIGTGTCSWPDLKRQGTPTIAPAPFHVPRVLIWSTIASNACFRPQNGMVLCDVKNATTTQITCLTRPHLATDASADDPNAVNVEPKSSFPDVVQVVGCAKGLKDILKFQCWSLPDAARAVAINPSDAMFSYDWSVSPVIASVTPTTVLPGDQFTVSGAVLGLVAEVQLVQNGAVRDLCVITNVDGGSVSCTVPASLPAGVYGVVLKAASGERSVAALGVTPAVGVIATLTGVTAGGAGSIAGWQTLTITAGGAGFNASVPSNNVVTVGGAPCNLTAVTSTTLTCLTNSIAGKVWGEYWRLPVNSWGSFPDLINWFNPGVCLCI